MPPRFPESRGSAEDKPILRGSLRLPLSGACPLDIQNGLHRSREVCARIGM